MSDSWRNSCDSDCSWHMTALVPRAFHNCEFMIGAPNFISRCFGSCVFFLFLPPCISDGTDAIKMLLEIPAFIEKSVSREKWCLCCPLVVQCSASAVGWNYDIALWGSTLSRKAIWAWKLATKRATKVRTLILALNNDTDSRDSWIHSDVY